MNGAFRPTLRSPQPCAVAHHVVAVRRVAKWPVAPAPRDMGNRHPRVGWDSHFSITALPGEMAESSTMKNAARTGQPLDQEMIDRLRSLGYVR